MAVATKADINRAQQRVLKWFDEHGRSFPWRENRDAYPTLVAEVMLQQTQTGRVGPSYAEFLHHFPTVESLARAPAMDVITAWKGLGYNKRAVELQRAAQQIVHEHGGEVPDKPKTLRALPGVGEYTANAIACTVFDKQVPVVDVNVQRVLARTALGVDGPVALKKTVNEQAVRWLPAGEAYRWNQALMDIGATLCRSETPLCSKCPLKAVCRFTKNGARKTASKKKHEPFEGSRRQKRGNIVDTMRAAAGKGITLGALGKAVDPGGTRRDLDWLVELLDGLTKDGLVEMSASAQRGSARGVVKLPR